MSFGQNLQFLRKMSNRMTQEELAEEFDKFLEVAESEDWASVTKSFKDDTLNFLTDLAKATYIVAIGLMWYSFCIFYSIIT